MGKWTLKIPLKFIASSIWGWVEGSCIFKSLLQIYVIITVSKPVIKVKAHPRLGAVKLFLYNKLPLIMMHFTLT